MLIRQFLQKITELVYLFYTSVKLQLHIFNVGTRHRFTVDYQYYKYFSSLKIYQSLLLNWKYLADVDIYPMSFEVGFNMLVLIELCGLLLHLQFLFEMEGIG